MVGAMPGRRIPHLPPWLGATGLWQALAALVALIGLVVAGFAVASAEHALAVYRGLPACSDGLSSNCLFTGTATVNSVHVTHGRSAKYELLLTPQGGTAEWVAFSDNPPLLDQLHPGNQVTVVNPAGGGITEVRYGGTSALTKISPLSGPTTAASWLVSMAVAVAFFSWRTWVMRTGRRRAEHDWLWAFTGACVTGVLFIAALEHTDSPAPFSGNNLIADGVLIGIVGLVHVVIRVVE
jgi:hypothetical protein